MKVSIHIPAPVGVPITSARHRDDPHGCDKDGAATHWVTKDNRRVKIKDMTDKHLLNSIRMIERVAPVAYEVELQAIVTALSMFDSESMASYYATQDFDRMLEGGPECTLDDNPLYLGLTKEAHRRNLTWK